MEEEFIKKFQLLYGMIYICADTAFIKLIHIKQASKVSNKEQLLH